ncbi:type II toxin-antitoxin system PemK/MazF family toxin [Orenia marismortui]|uniref:type II toxin-antitoxin system PemK/MazF family toxin n=1 Tax=Orenia marismortui TaxID=46469 RepID=UPI00035ECF9E|nr:type II toxin-antitoxin system PemK/MazF family toxin [Orenia marismortui]
MKKSKIEIIKELRKNAKHGEFFLAKFTLPNGRKRKAPVLIISAEHNDKEDVVVCSCTGQPAKTSFDILVKLRRDTHVRTNKIYTMSRNQLLFKIPQTLNKEQYNKIIEKIKLALKL